MSPAITHFWGLCSHSVGGAYNACVVVRIKIALNFFSINCTVVHPVLFFNK